MYKGYYKCLYRHDSGLRSYQQSAKETICATWDKVDNILFQMPIGTGKTQLLASLIKDLLELDKREGKIVIIAHRWDLLDQISEILTRHEIAHGILFAGKKQDLTQRVQIAPVAIGMQVKNHTVDEYADLKIDYLIIDEAHNTVTRPYAVLCRRFKNAKKLGITATPWRMKNGGFTAFDCYPKPPIYFQEMITSPVISWFIENKYLAPCECHSIEEGAEAKQLTDSYLAFAKGKKGIVYTANKVQGKSICLAYENAGLTAAYIDNRTRPKAIDTAIQQFQEGKVQVIVNTGFFSDGFACPEVQFIQLASPTESLAEYLQQVSLGMRPAKDGSACVILDHVGSMAKFGLPSDDRQWLIEGR